MIWIIGYLFGEYMYVKLAGSYVYPSTYMVKYGGDDTTSSVTTKRRWNYFDMHPCPIYLFEKHVTDL